MMFKKVLLITVALILLCSITFGTVDTTEITFDVVTSGTFDQRLRGWIDTLNTDIINAGVLSNVGTGRIYYVDSAAGGSATSVGTKPEWAWPTLDDAFDSGHTVANRGDIVFVMQGHTEDWTAADSADIDVAGVTVIGLGNGTNRPTFIFDNAAAELVIGDVDIVVLNLVFQPSVNQTVHAIEIEADADGSIVGLCEFLSGETEGTDEFIDAIQPASGADDLIIRYNKATSLTAGANTWLDMTAGVLDNTIVVGNEAFGNYAEACIFSDDADTQNLITDNTLTNNTSGAYCIEFTAAATGTSTGNKCYTDAYGTTINPGSMKDGGGNYVNDTINEPARTFPISYTDQMLQMLVGSQLRQVPGAGHPQAFWYVDNNITSGDGKTPDTAFKTITEALAVCDNAVEDWIFVYDYSGNADSGTITWDKSWVHLIGHNHGIHPWPRIFPTADVPGITAVSGASFVEIINFTIGGGANSPGIQFPVGSNWSWHIRNCAFGLDASSLCEQGIEVVSGGDAVSLLVEDNTFRASVSENGILISGVSTRGMIRNNYFQNIGSAAQPAIHLAGGTVGTSVVGNHILASDDDTVGWGITLGASCDQCWVSDNVCSSSSSAPATSGYDDDRGDAENNGWGINYDGASAVIPD